jgi:hypothetical protein
MSHRLHLIKLLLWIDDVKYYCNNDGKVNRSFIMPHVDGIKVDPICIQNEVPYCKITTMAMVTMTMMVQNYDELSGIKKMEMEIPITSWTEYRLNPMVRYGVFVSYSCFP